MNAGSFGKVRRRSYVLYKHVAVSLVPSSREPGSSVRIQWKARNCGASISCLFMVPQVFGVYRLSTILVGCSSVSVPDTMISYNQLPAMAADPSLLPQSCCPFSTHVLFVSGYKWHLHYKIVSSTLILGNSSQWQPVPLSSQVVRREPVQSFTNT